MKTSSSPLVGLRTMLTRPRTLALMGILLIAAGVWAPVPASATFIGATNGNVAFASVCTATIGQAIYSVNPVGSPPPTYSCPGGTAPNSTQSTAGSIDSMPYFSSQGTTLYFSSDRLSNGNNPGANGNFAIYQVTYPPTVSGSPGSQTDGAVQITFPAAGGGSSNDYAPPYPRTGTSWPSSGATRARRHVRSTCRTRSSAEQRRSCRPRSPLLQPNSVSGEASRPEINPADPSPSSLRGHGQPHPPRQPGVTCAFTERDLSNESGIPAGQIDEYPDWNTAGTRIIFDRSHSNYVLDPTTGPATACKLWGTSDPGTEIEPIFAPTDTAASSSTSCNPSGNMYVWTKLGGGSNIILDMGHAVGEP